MTQKEPLKKTLWMDRGEVEKFTKHHPSHGAFTYFVNEALKRYNELCEFDPDELIETAVKNVKF